MTKSSPSARQRRRAFWLLWAAMPLLAVGYQIAAEEAARALSDRPLDLIWLRFAASLPWFQALVVIDVVSFVAWMVVLAEFKLSEAFTISAVGYVLVIAVSWTVFGEPAGLSQIIGAGAILVGVWLIGRGEGAPC